MGDQFEVFKDLFEAAVSEILECTVAQRIWADEHPVWRARLESAFRSKNTLMRAIVDPETEKDFGSFPLMLMKEFVAECIPGTDSNHARAHEFNIFSRVSPEINKERLAERLRKAEKDMKDARGFQKKHTKKCKGLSEKEGDPNADYIRETGM